MDDKKVSELYFEADSLLMEMIKETAKKVMSKHPSIVKYVQGMGAWFFVDKKGKDYNGYKDHYGCGDTLSEPIADIMNKWDDAFKLTGDPLQIIKNSDGTFTEITDW